ncbi:MAG: YdaU family protein [Beijerinckiaceae bacterium]|nr:YdaU family protein [Beijerinckiaceae bacterium]
MSKHNWFPFYPDAFISGTAKLSAAECGVYIKLLATMYDSGGPIVRDDARLARLCGLPKAAFSKALGVLIEEGKINFDGQCLVNLRVKNEVTEIERRKLAAAENAKSRWQKQKGKQRKLDANPYAESMQPQCEPICETDAESMLRARAIQLQSSSLRSEDTSPSLRSGETSSSLRSEDSSSSLRSEEHFSLTSVREKYAREETISSPSQNLLARTNGASRLPPAVLSNFERFWDAWPHKVGKAAARKAFQTAAGKTSIEEILDAIDRYVAVKPKDRPWCNPATWLNQERWLDEEATPPRRNVFDLYRERKANGQTESFNDAVCDVRPGEGDGPPRSVFDSIFGPRR